MPTALMLGMGTTALSALESLVTRFRVLGVVRPPGTDPGTRDVVVAAAAEHGVPVLVDASPAGVAATVADLEPDVVVMSSYDRILPNDVLGLAPFVNVHYSPLPRYRGRANVNWAIINGEPSAAISVHAVTPGLDDGNILFQRLVPISDRDTVGDLYDKLNALQREHLAPTVAAFLDGDVGHPQDEAAATYCCTRIPADGLIDWTRPTPEIDRLIRALGPPFPGAFTHFGIRRLWIHRAEPSPAGARYVGRVPGRVVGRSRRNGWVDVLTGDGVLRLHDVQLEGDTPRAAADEVPTLRATLGLRTGDLLEQIGALERRLEQLTARVSESR